MINRNLKTLLMVCAVAIIALPCLAAGPAPLAMNNKAIGGGPLNDFTPGVTNGTGLNNIGLLVRTTGKVTYVDTTNKFFYIDDGSALEDGTTNALGELVLGVRVSYANLAPGASFICPSFGTYWAITGISSTTQISVSGGDVIIPTLRPRNNADKTPV